MNATSIQLIELPHSLAEEVVEELVNPDYATRTHGTRSCHNAGCRGPLCTKFNRDRSRKVYRKNNPETSRKRVGARDPVLDSFLDAVIEAHAQDKEQKERLSA